jgi:DNA-binding CsgD family transcriptional regulator
LSSEATTNPKQATAVQRPESKVRLELTEKELQIIRLAHGGMNDELIAQTLGMGPFPLAYAWIRIRMKTGGSSKQDSIRFALGSTPEGSPMDASG